MPILQKPPNFEYVHTLKRLVDSRRQHPTLAAAPVLFVHAVVTVAKTIVTSPLRIAPGGDTVAGAHPPYVRFKLNIRYCKELEDFTW